MFKIFRNERYLNTNYVSDGVKGYELAKIVLHDGVNVLASDRWLADKYGSNSSLDYGYEKGLTFEYALILKRSHDLTLKAFIIKEKTDVYSWSETGYVLYLHKDILSGLKHKKEINEGLGWLYDIYYNDDVYFKSLTLKLRDESKAIENKIRETIKELNTCYDMGKIEKLSNNLKRNTKKYQIVFNDETLKIRELKATLKENESI